MKVARLLLVLLLLSLATQAQAQNTDWWASGETLLWWTKSGPAPPPLALTAPPDRSSLTPGDDRVSVALGDERITQPMQVGGRFAIGTWLGPASVVGIEGNYLFLGKSTSSTTVTNNGTEFLVNPVIDVSTGIPLPAANFLAIPGDLSRGSATLTTSHQLQGGEINGLYALSRQRSGYVTLLGGYRFLNVDEGLTLSTTQGDSSLFYPGEFVLTTDQFNTRNFFNGAQLGLRTEWYRGRWFWGATFKAALGNTREVLHVRGSTTTNAGPGFSQAVPVETVPTGIYAESTNIGNYHQDRFAVLPEVTVRVGRQVTQRLQLFVGYDFLYLSSIARPGNQIDNTINSTQLVSFTGLPPQYVVGEARPAPRLLNTSYWAQGINLGAQLNW